MNIRHALIGLIASAALCSGCATIGADGKISLLFFGEVSARSHRDAPSMRDSMDAVARKGAGGPTYVGLRIPVGSTRNVEQDTAERGEAPRNIQPGMSYHSFIASLGPSVVMVTPVEVAVVEDVQRMAAVEPGMSFDALMASLGVYDKVSMR